MLNWSYSHVNFRLPRFFYQIGLAALLLIAALSSCRKDEFNTSPDFRLTFSTDTVSFDTIFQSIGSATQLLKVYNNSDEFISIDRVSVIDSCDNYDPFRLNVDGISGSTVRDVEIGPNDSAFVFVEVTIDPNQLCSALELGVVEFSINGNLQRVTLFAFGLDAIFHVPDVFPTNGLPAFSRIEPDPNVSTITWTPDKPIVIFGYAVVDSGQTLIIEPGTQIYFHQGAGLWVLEEGNIQCGSLMGETVVFQGDRLEPFFDEEPGQWDRIWIFGGSENNVFENTVIKNNFIGIQIEPSIFEETFNTIYSNNLILRNVAIRNNSATGIFSRNYRIQAENLLMSAAGQNCLALTGGGQYRFAHCTFANNWSASTRQTPAVFLTNVYQVDAQTIAEGNVENSRFRNCIIHGNGLNEFGFDFTDQNIDLTIDHTMIRMQEDDFNELDSQYFGDGIFVGFDPGFVDFSGGDFRLREDAEARFKGINQGALPDFDLIGTPYAFQRPLGCFEFLPE